MGGGIGVVGRGCIPGGIGAEKRPASRERLAYTDPRAENRSEEPEKADFTANGRKFTQMGLISL